MSEKQCVFLWSFFVQPDRSGASSCVGPTSVAKSGTGESRQGVSPGIFEVHRRRAQSGLLCDRRRNTIYRRSRRAAACSQADEAIAFATPSAVRLCPRREGHCRTRAVPACIAMCRQLARHVVLLLPKGKPSPPPPHQPLSVSGTHKAKPWSTGADSRVAIGCCTQMQMFAALAADFATASDDGRLSRPASCRMRCIMQWCSEGRLVALWTARQQLARAHKILGYVAQASCMLQAAGDRAGPQATSQPGRKDSASRVRCFTRGYCAAT